MSKLYRFIASAVLLIVLFSSCNKAGTKEAALTNHMDSQNNADTSVVASSENNNDNTNSPEPDITIDNEPIEYLESAKKWINKLSTPDKIILSEKEIEERNRLIRNNTDTIVDIFTYGDTVTREMVHKALNNEKINILPAYDRHGKAFEKEEYLKIIDNCAADMPEEFDPWRAVVVSRASLRLLPYEDGLYSSPSNKCDILQLTELHVGTPIWMLHPSADGKFLYVRAYHYEGWVAADCVAITDDENTWRAFAVPERFAVIISPMVKIGGEKYDMGSRIPILEKKEDEYSVMIPIRDAGGMLECASDTVSFSDAHEGYLKYTYAAVLNQAFKYEGTDYGWGGLNDGVDCSSFIGNVFSTFGFVFPRDTGEQDHSVGNPKLTMYMSDSEISDLLRKSIVPTIIYYPGHTMLFVGYNDGKFSFIHAPEIGKSVCVVEKDNFKGVTYINSIS